MPAPEQTGNGHQVSTIGSVDIKTDKRPLSEYQAQGLARRSRLRPELAFPDEGEP
jgi:hypothetical protein